MSLSDCLGTAMLAGNLQGPDRGRVAAEARSPSRRQLSRRSRSKPVSPLPTP